MSRPGIRRILLAALAASSALGGTTWSLSAAAAERVVTVGDSWESWQHDGPSLPAGSYPAGTLHVGVLLGRETDRTYLMPGLPQAAVAGAMTLPLATDTGAGTFDPAGATIEGCLVTATRPAVEAGPCRLLTYDAGGSVFRLDLGPFISAWNDGRPRLGIALVPVLVGSSPLASWHVAFDGDHRAGHAGVSSRIVLAAGPAAPAPVAPAPAPAGGLPGPAAPVATVAVVSPAAPTTPTPPAPSRLPLVPTAPAQASAGVPATAPSAPASGGGAPLALSPAAVAPSVVTLARLHTDERRLYLALFLAPVALAAGCLFFIRLFTTNLSILHSSEAYK